ncbi:hypothetical protein LguiB_017980 [Lonicera macranthoides]
MNTVDRTFCCCRSSVENTTPLRSEDNTISQMGTSLMILCNTPRSVPKVGRSNTLFPNKYHCVQLDISISMTYEAMGLVFPAGLVWGDLNTDSSLLVIRLSHFKCGGISIANNYNFFYCSSLCRMEFYQVDFGWGNPSRVTLADAPGKNNFFLMDTPDGDGIAAVVYDVGIPIKSPKIAPFLTLKACMSVCRQMRVLGYKNGENRVKISTTRLQDRSWGSQDRSWELSAKTFVSHNINFICVLPSQTPEMLESLLRPNTKVVEENDMELLA